MIFVILGTHELPFTRLLKEVERLKKNGVIAGEVVVQSGHTSFKSDVMTMIDFMSYEEMEGYFDEANYIITHGGTGSIVTAAKKGKKIIAAARLIKYHEHNDDHQLEIIRQFVEAGHILEWKDGEDMADVIRQLSSFHPVPFVSGQKQILSLLENFIDQL